MTRPLVVVDVVGMTPRLLPHMPRLTALAAGGFASPLGAAFPAVTCSGQASLLTGLPPSGHGVVGNGWFFRDLGEVWLWRQGHGLVEGETVWEAARRRHPGLRIANLCWWYAMGAPTDYTVTPRPVYHADGRKSPDCYTRPPALHDELEAELGPFPLFQFWGPGARIASSRWIGRAAEIVLERHRPDVTFVYLPHLDYDLQRFGPAFDGRDRALGEVDRVVGAIVQTARDLDVEVIALSEYGITAVRGSVSINRALRREGLLRVHHAHNGEILDAGASRAFAVADHQVAHVYVRDAADIATVGRVLAGLDGVDRVLDREAQASFGLDHARSGELVAVSRADRWFDYYYWLDDAKAPDFARTVDIHRKPGYDPLELFIDDSRPLMKARVAAKLLGRKLGLRTVLDVVSFDTARVGGSHGRLPDRPEDGPVLISSSRRQKVARLEMREVRDLILATMFDDGSPRSSRDQRAPRS